MRPETLLAAGAALVVVAGAVVVLAVPGAVAGPDEEPGFARLTDATVAAAEVGPDDASLTVTAVLQHRGGRSENLSVRARMTHLASGLHATTERADVPAVEGEREVEVPLNVTVPREGGYRVELFLFDDGERRGTLSREIRGVGELQPSSARSSVRFHRFDRAAGNDTLPSVQTAVEAAGDDEVTLNVSAYLTNEGGEERGDLSVQFVVRQADSGLVAERTRVPLGTVPAQHTVVPSATVTVPDGYNYYVDAILWKGGVIVDSARGVANLAPAGSLQVDRDEEEGGLQVSDFERDDDAAGEPTPGPQGTRAQSPGFGAGVALLALLGAALFARRQA